MLLKEIQKKIETAKTQKAEMLKELQKTEEQIAQYMEAARLIQLAEGVAKPKSIHTKIQESCTEEFNTSVYSARRVGVYDVHAYKCGCQGRRDEHVCNLKGIGAKWEVEEVINEDFMTGDEDENEDGPVYTEKNGGVVFYPCFLEMVEAREKHLD